MPAWRGVEGGDVAVGLGGGVVCRDGVGRGVEDFLLWVGLGELERGCDPWAGTPIFCCVGAATGICPRCGVTATGVCPLGVGSCAATGVCPTRTGCGDGCLSAGNQSANLPSVEVVWERRVLAQRRVLAWRVGRAFVWECGWLALSVRCEEQRVLARGF